MKITNRRNKNKVGLFLLLFLPACLISCNSEYTIKRKGYFRIDLPVHEYQTFDGPGYPFSFEYPVYSSVVRDTSFFEEEPESPYWINIDFPSLNGKIYISYKDVRKSDLDKLVNDAFKLTY